MSAATFFSLDGRSRDGFGNGQQRREIEGGVPAGVVIAIARDTDLLGLLPETLESLQGFLHLIFFTHDPDKVLHRLLQLVLNLERATSRFRRDRKGKRVFGDLVDLRVVDLPELIFLRILGGVFAGALAEDQQVGQRIAAQAVGAVDAGRTFPRGEEAGDARHLRIAVDAHATHDVVGGRADFHRLGGDVDVGQLLELVIHARQLLLDVLGGVRQLFLDPGDVEKHAAVRAAAAGFDFAHDAARHMIAGEQFRRPPRVLITLSMCRQPSSSLSAVELL